MMANVTWPLLCVFLIISQPGESFSQLNTTPGGFTQVGHWTEGPGLGLAKAADVVYLGSGASLEAISVTDPTAPLLLDRLNLPSTVTGLAEKNGYLYAVTMDGKFMVVDVSDPTDLQQVAVLQGSACWSAVSVSGNSAYWANDALRVVDIENPLQPQLMAEHSYAVVDVAVQGNHVFAASFGRGLIAFDILASGDLVERLVIDAMGNTANGVHAVGAMVYLSTTTSCAAFDFTEPWQSFIAPIETWGSMSNGFATQEMTVYTGNEYGLSAHCIDGSCPDFHEWGSSNAWEMIAADELLYTAHDHEGLVIYDISDSAHPIVVGRHSAGTGLVGLSISDNRAYLACGDQGLKVLDLDDPHSPQFLGEISSMEAGAENLMEVESVGVHEGHALLLGMAGVHLVDSSSPSDLHSVVSTRDINGVYTGRTRNSVTLGDHWVFSGDNIGWTSLEISESSEASFLPFQWPGNAVVNKAMSHNEYLYASDGDGSLWIFDTDSTGEIRLRGETEVPDGVNHLSASGNRLYLVDELVDVSILNVGNPGQPVLLGYLDQEFRQNEIISMAADNDFIYTIEAHHGLRLIDVRDPGNPATVGYYPVGDIPLVVAVHENLIYVATRYGGIKILSNDLLSTSALPEVSHEFSVSAAPNPFNPLTRISFDLPEAATVKVNVFDLRGRRVRQLHDGWLDAGSREFVWSGRDDGGRQVAAGSYLVRSEAGAQSQTIKVTMAK